MGFWKSSLFYVSLGLVLGIALTSSAYRYFVNVDGNTIIVTSDTVRDTVEIPVKVEFVSYVPKEVIRYIDQTRIITDTMIIYGDSGKSDTIDFILPVEIANYVDTVYQDKDTISYSAYVSGYKPVLDSIRFDLRKNYIEYSNTVKETAIFKEKKKHFSLSTQFGIGAQYGLIHGKFDVGPYLGVGLSYNFVSF